VEREKLYMELRQERHKLAEEWVNTSSEEKEKCEELINRILEIHELQKEIRETII